MRNGNGAGDGDVETTTRYGSAGLKNRAAREVGTGSLVVGGNGLARRGDSSAGRVDRRIEICPVSVAEG